MKQPYINYDFTLRPELIYDVPFDEGIKDLLYIFNKLGLRTQYSCEGHKEDKSFYIAFNDCVTDEQIYRIVKYSNELPNFGQNNSLIHGFKKWLRPTSKGNIKNNWTFRYYYTDDICKTKLLVGIERALELLVVEEEDGTI